MRFVLASASPRRAELLRAAGYTFDIVATDVDESMKLGESPSGYVRRLAAEKSMAALAVLKGGAISGAAQSFSPAAGRSDIAQASSPAEAILVGADTAVVIEGEVLGKPRDDADAAAMLRRLSGRQHEVLTGISLRQGAYELGRVETTTVWFIALTKNDIDWYVASGECRDKAGAYAIQGLASRFVPRIEGSFSNVVGLPVAALVELLTEFRQR